MGILTAISVRTAKSGRHGDGDGLFLLVKPSGARSWLLRIQQDGRRRDIGLGTADVSSSTRKAGDPVDEVPILHRRVLTLAEAREKAALLRRFAKAGRDPVIERDRDRKATPTFEVAALACHEALKEGWTAKNAEGFLSSLKEHAFPALRAHRVDTIDASHVRDALAPIWTTIPAMARKVRHRIGTVLNFARSKGWRTAEAPGRAVTVGLSRQARAGNHAAMPFVDVPGFVADVQAGGPSNGRRALLFTLLTAARSGEVRSARWSHIDLDARTWNRPAELMKAREAHTVTLNDAAVNLLRNLRGEKLVGSDRLIFPGVGGKPISDMTLTKVLRDAGQTVTVHGFRSSFRDWAAERMPTIPDAVAEAALAHVVPDKVVRAYKRTSFLEMRRTLLDAWGRFVTGARADVVQLPVRKAG